MADLYDRLFIKSEDYENISSHYFYAALVDLAAGETTKTQIITAFELDSQAENNLDALISAYQLSSNKNQWLQELHSVMMLAEARLKYNTPAAFAARMGL